VRAAWPPIAPPALLRRGIALVLATMLSAHTAAAPAQTPDELNAARKLFTEAVADEDARRYDTALEKFRRVAAVKDTANVRYRIATCLEGLGRVSEALRNYETAVRLGEGDKASADAVRASTARSAELDRTVPRLTIVLPDSAPAGTDVRVDDAPVDAATLRAPIPLDPGHHTIAATAAGDLPFRTGVTLPEGGRVTITIALEPIPPPPPTAVSAGGTGLGAPGASASPSGSAPHAGGEPTEPAQPSRTGAYIALGVGGALAAGSVISFLLVNANNSTINKDCSAQGQGGALTCPSSLQSEVNTARNAALTERVLGYGLGGGAIVALGIGAWLLWSAAPSSAPAGSAKQSVRVAPVVSEHGAMVVVGGAVAPNTW
jgi:hypothetical protein